MCSKGQPKFFELRDKGTCISLMAMRLHAGNSKERWLLSRAGYGSTYELQSEYVMIANVDGGTFKMTFNPLEWESETMRIAHMYIRKNFDRLELGQVVDVQWIMNETPEQCESDFYKEAAYYVSRE